MRKICLITLVLAVALLSGCSEPVSEAPELLEPVGVKLDTDVVSRGPIYSMNIYDGAVEPYVEELYFTVDGEIDEVYSSFGDYVNQGDIILTLDQEDAEKRAEELREAIAYTEESLKLQRAMSEVDIRMKELEIANLTSTGPAEGQTQEEINIAVDLLRADIEGIRMSLEQSEQSVRQLELSSMLSELESIESTLGDNVIRAPFSGTIVFGEVLKSGDYVQAYAPLVYISDDTRLKVVTDFIAESYINGASRVYAMIGGGEYPIIYQPIDRDEYISAVLSGATVKTSFEFEEGAGAGGEVEPGRFAAVVVISGYVEDALVVPSNAVFREGSIRYIYVMEGDSRVRREVKLGAVTSGLTQIVSGAEEGEVIYVKD